MKETPNVRTEGKMKMEKFWWCRKERKDRPNWSAAVFCFHRQREWKTMKPRDRRRTKKKMKMKKNVVGCEDATWCAVNGWAAAMWVGDDAESQSHAHYPQTQRHTRHGTIYTKAQRNVILDVESGKSRKQDEEEERQELEALRKTRRLLSTLDTYVIICCREKKG